MDVRGPLDPLQIADALLHSSPGWARAGLTAPTEHMRRQAAKELAETIVDHIKTGPSVADARQLSLLA